LVRDPFDACAGQQFTGSPVDHFPAARDAAVGFAERAESSDPISVGPVVLAGSHVEPRVYVSVCHESDHPCEADLARSGESVAAVENNPFSRDVEWSHNTALGDVGSERLIFPDGHRRNEVGARVQAQRSRWAQNHIAHGSLLVSAASRPPKAVPAASRSNASRGTRILRPSTIAAIAKCWNELSGYRTE
jgi:hypothetical protein